LTINKRKCSYLKVQNTDRTELDRIIGDDTGAGDQDIPGADETILLGLYRSLVLLRTFDERSVVYHRQGRIGTYALHWGHEAIQAGAVHALADADWIFPTYRESAVGLLRGMPAATILQWWRGHPSGWWNPAEYRVASICVPIATQVPHAAGLAWGKRLAGEKACALAFFGDGATSEGAFHEGVNLAAVMQAPVVLLCNNNHWAISTPLTAQSRARSLADKAAGYGIPARRVDGTDVLAVYDAVREAASRASAGEGPTFIEAVHYRAAPHATADDPSAYIDGERVLQAREQECVGKLERYLQRKGCLDESTIADVKADALAQLRAGIESAEQEPPADVGFLFDNVYSNPPAELGAQFAELQAAMQQPREDGR
jgi:pyruvate dehydrogenase E1 component alpha subunit